MADNKKSNVTSKDVAKLAGVSQSTVSRVFIDGSSSSESTRKKVMDAARTLNYRPNAFARSLTTNESKLIGLVFPDADYPIHMETLQLLSKELQRNGYSAVLIPWVLDEQNHHTIPNIFQYKVDAVIAASAQFNTALYEECRDFNIPIVQFARVEEGTKCSYAISDNYSAGQSAAAHFINSGSKKLAYLTGDIPTLTNQERMNGFNDCSEDLLGCIPATVTGSYNYDGCLDTIRKMLTASDRPDAVFCSTDIIAMALMDVAKLEFGIKIPEELQVIGFDDIPQSNWLSYQISTFRQDFKRLARESVKIVVNQIREADNSLVKLMVPTQLIFRQSTRK
ncbi:LacI family DNA-binding transcriptional regulator [Vibrio tapetis subsp. quintayensis]|uniref:LacI family DNA-binding transcriptional regulator n=1 Tax=Vibrio tapetis TaxID=52443 RepID=UPI0025B530A6|nr:LacI family DNA-binding transcriptional regulator [Vibrio tapetis]MDN3682900.1 LacI family DNA-binding transcriptional regulator [Vibrio tapetis subsp. quintayensis]